MKDSRSPHMRELRAQLNYAPATVRSQHLRRLETLLTEIDTEREYPYSYIFFRITAFNPDGAEEKIFKGDELLPDLARLLSEMTRKLAELSADQPEKILTINEAAIKCAVSVRTMLRWRNIGLPLRWFRFSDGRLRVGLRKTLLDQFVITHSERVTRSAGFSRITEVERREIISLARNIRQATGEGITGVTERVAEITGRSAESVRTVIRQHDNRNPADRIFPSPSEHMSDEERARMAELFEQGATIQELCRRYGRSRSAVYAAVRAYKCARIAAEKIRFIHSPEFDLPGAETIILGAAGAEEPLDIPPPPVADCEEDPFEATVSLIPVLPPERERDLFRRYNYLKFRMFAIQGKIAERGYRSADVNAFEKMQRIAGRIREFLIRSNLRLVAGIARRHTGPVVGFSDLVSMGTIALMRAVESFDYSRGNKFSTYASWAVSKEYARRVPEENYRIVASISEKEQFLEAPETFVEEERRRKESITHLRHVIKKAIGGLDDLERDVIRERFGLEAGQALTLDEVGDRHGLTGERIRQIQNGAMAKLRRLIGPDALEALPG